MAIINYYEKYGFSQTDDLVKIQWVINQKIADEENDSFGEGHSDKMFILQLAKEAFANTESKAKYDKELADSQKKSDPDGDRKASFEKWYADAKSYFDSNQYDLAKTAIDRAFQYATTETADCDFYGYASNIYSLTANFSQAVDYANQAIVLAPDIFYGYYVKMVALDRYMFGKNLGSDQRQDIYKQLEPTINLMLERAIKSGHNNVAAQGYGLLAKMYYTYVDGTAYPVSGYNNAHAEEYAQKSVSLTGMGQADPLAKAVLDDIASRRAKIAELEQANANLRQKLESDSAGLRANLKRDNDALGEDIRKFKSEQQDWKNKIGGASDPPSHGCQFFVRSLYLYRFMGKAINVMVIGSIILAAIGAIVFFVGNTGAGIVMVLIGGAILAMRAARVSRNKRISVAYWNAKELHGKITQAENTQKNNENQMNNTINNLQYTANATIQQNDNVIAQQKAGLAEQSGANINTGANPSNGNMSKIEVIKVIREITGKSLKDATDMVNGNPRLSSITGGVREIKEILGIA